jgi:hypothetical protein
VQATWTPIHIHSDAGRDVVAVVGRSAPRLFDLATSLRTLFHAHDPDVLGGAVVVPHHSRHLLASRRARALASCATLDEVVGFVKRFRYI